MHELPHVDWRISSNFCVNNSDCPVIKANNYLKHHTASLGKIDERLIEFGIVNPSVEVKFIRGVALACIQGLCYEQLGNNRKAPCGSVSVYLDPLLPGFFIPP